MANTTSSLNLNTYGGGGRSANLPVDGGATLYKGALVAQLEGTGMLCPANTATSGPAVGVAEHDADNATGSDGDVRCMVHYDRIFIMANATGGDACSEATPFLSPVYMYDDHTIADNSAGGTQRPCGYFAGMEPDGKVRFYVPIGKQPSAGSGGDEFDDGIATDTIAEFTAAAGVTADGVLLKDGGIVLADGATIEADIIAEATSAAGVTADGVLLKDAKVTASGGADLGATPGLVVDLISEKTGAAGVTIDSLQIKDGGLPVFAPGITKLQLASGTFVSGTATISTGIVVTADTVAIPVNTAAVTGSTNVGTPHHLKASNSVGGAGVGSIVMQMLGNDGAIDTDAAGAFSVLLIN